MREKIRFTMLPFLTMVAFLVFASSCGEEDDITSEIKVPTITTLEVSEISHTTAAAGGEITDDGGVDVEARGICWDTSEEPTVNDSKTEDGKGLGSFTSSITGLEPNTTYYLRAYATNSEGTAYGDIISFTTSEIKMPAITTLEVSEIAYTSATAGGEITDDGGVEITARGVCWGTSQEPTIEDSKTEDGSGLGSFTSSITELEPNTTYYLRAYATNSEGTGYGSALSFTTLEIKLPTITTIEVSEIDQTVAKAGGEITDDGGADVTVRGVCWSTSQEPTIDDSKTENGTGIGSFTSNITELRPNTTYYLRAYATNSAGTGYGSALSFTTLELETGTFTDTRDGNVYNWVKIGNQVWMVENLKYLPSVVGPSTNSPTTPYYYVHSYDGTNVNAAKATDNYEKYGVIYNWPAVNSGNICPSGWRVPTNAEWTALTDYLGGASEAGNKLKSTSGWYENGNGIDLYGFAALPSSGLSSDGEFFELSSKWGYWWSATWSTSWAAWSRNMNSFGNRVGSGEFTRRESGQCVRCIKNN
ncbi:MAG: hypothetical protein LAT68_14115 [Cyclobacteriaceae bacterium]|nr:hypothetical protein [Cyclobacteriaceae bacterium]MCH8517456.1 hypothetical protein [Cyclobacteriaceae bacterium]